MDFQKLKDSLLQDTTAEERVEVNQRHLIDKILARYSAEYTVFRELLQNSNDAGATAAQIIFTTNKEKAPKSSFLWITQTTTTVQSITYKNNGRPFSEEDFARLRKIAEGNPDEQKIGFFGVGFYSLFSLCEEPFVTSGETSMAFLWKNDMLYTKRGAIPKDQQSEWTSFFLSMRETTEMPKLENFLKFLVSSLAFVSNLKTIEVFENDKRLLFLHRKAKAPIPLELPSSTVFKFQSPQGLFHLRSISVEKVQLDVQITRDRDSSLSSSTTSGFTEHTVYLRVAAGKIDANLPKKLVDEMNRTTKKNPPTTTHVRIMFSNHDEYDSSTVVRKVVDYFDALIPPPEGQGRVFIGFPTHQTTGFAGLLACHLIPTVERESIDFVDPALNYWNQEMLSVAGILARVIYEHELNDVQELYESMKLDTSSQQWLRKRANHALGSFTFKVSTPSGLVGQLISSTFFKNATCPFRIMSTRGLMNARDVRIPDETIQSFTKTIPFVTPETMADCKELVDRLITAKTLVHVKVEDILQELRTRPLETEECLAFMRWWISKVRSGIVTTIHIQTLKSIMKWKSSKNETAEGGLSLQNVTHFGHPRLLGSDLPFPPFVLPLELSHSFSEDELKTCFWSWKPLTALEWARFIIQHEHFIASPPFTEKAMSGFSRQSNNMSNEDKAILMSLLVEKPCIITQFGMRTPSQSYFKTVTLFDDLPIVAFQGKLVFDGFLKALGVREHVDLQMVFNRLDDLNWNQVQLIKYLASVSSKLANFERERLMNSSIFLAATGATQSSTEKSLSSSISNLSLKKLVKDSTPSSSSKQDSLSESSTTMARRYKASSLFVPSDFFMELGLPVLQWTGKWRSHSEEAKFMTSLGLCDVVPLNTLLILISKESDDSKRLRLLKYFVDQYESTYKGLYRPESIEIAFLPIVSLGGETASSLARPRDCFTDPRAKVMGYPILLPSLCIWATPLGIAEAPRGSVLVEKLARSPPSLETASETFAFLSSRQHDFSSTDWGRLKSLRFIPVLRSESPSMSIEHVSPSTVYFKGSQGNADLYSSHFIYVDFGNPSNAFLRACGVKDQPSPLEIASHVVEDPSSFLTTLGFDRYLSLLREIAANYSSTISRNSKLVSKMKTTPFLVAIRGSSMAIPSSTDKKHANASSVSDDADQEKIKCTLEVANNIALIDDTVLAQLFQPLSAPMDHLLEPMYYDLGSRWLSSQVTESHAPSGSPSTTQDSEHLQGVIRQRAPILLYDGHQMRPSGDVIPSVTKLLESIRVYSIPNIDIVRVFRGETRRSKTTAASIVTRRDGPVLLLTPGFDYYDVASALGKMMLKKPRLNDFLLISTLLSSSLENLRLKGFPVDRILNLQASLLKKPVVVEPPVTTAPPPVPDKRQRELGSTVSTNTVNTTISTAQGSQQTSQQDPRVQELLSIFPDADPEFLKSRVERYGPNPDPAQFVQLVEELLQNGYPKNEKNTVNGGHSLDDFTSKIMDVFPDADLEYVQNLSQRHDRVEGAVNEMTERGYPKKRQQLMNDVSQSTRNSGFFSSLEQSLSQTLGTRGRDLIQNASSWMNTLASSGGNPMSLQQTTTPAGGAHKIDPNNTKQMQSLLKTAIQHSRGKSQSGFQADIPLQDPPQPLRNECRARSQQDLVLIQHVGVTPIYVDRSCLETAKVELSQEPGISDLNRFVAVLSTLGSVFELPREAIHVYWDNDGATIAFNASRALFFNFRFFSGLHAKNGKRLMNGSSIMKESTCTLNDASQEFSLPGGFITTSQSPKKTNSSTTTAPVVLYQESPDTYYYWFMTFCHELAHNFVSEHNSNHEYWMSSFAEQYMASLFKTLVSQGVLRL